MKISSIVIAVFTLSCLAGGLSIFYTDVSSNYGVTIEENQSLRVLNQSYAINNMTTNLTTTLNSGGGLLEKVYFSVGLIWGAISILLTLPLILLDMINSMLSLIPGVPGWFIFFIGGIPAIIIIFKIIDWFTGKET